MPVTFDDYTDTYKRISHIIVNAQNALKKTELSDVIKEKAKYTLKLLRDSFHLYLNAIKNDDDFPVFVEDKNVLSEDFRILLFYKLADNIRKGQFTLPDKIKRTNINFAQLGWPVSVESPGFYEWLVFIRSIRTKLKEQNSALDLDRWAGRELPVSTRRRDLADNQGFDDRDEDSLDGNTTLPTAQDEQAAESCDLHEWDAPADFKPLVASVKKMHDHGEEIIAKESAKGVAAKKLAIELAKDLRTFNALTPDEQEAQKETFIAGFEMKLHREDNLMAAQRAVWKNIVANILVAMAVVGLVAFAAPLAGVGMVVAGAPVVPATAGVLFGAIALKCLFTSHGFFGNTQSEKNVATVAAEFSATELSC